MIGTSTGMVTDTKWRGCRPAMGCLAVAIVLAWSSVCAADVQNPSFESYYYGFPYPRKLPANWLNEDHASFNSYCSENVGTLPSAWSTEGTWSAALFSRLTNGGKRYIFAPGDFQSFYQRFVNLTGIRSIVFDVRLAAFPSGLFEHFEASFLVDGVPLWSQTQGGEYLNQEVILPGGLINYHRIEIRITALESGYYPVAYWTQWDNLRLVEGPTAIEAVVVLDPNILNLSSNGKWITCYIDLPEDYEVGTINGAMVKLGDIPAYMGEEGWATPAANEGNLVDHDADGALERMVKFDRSAVEAVVRPPATTVTVTGELADGRPFEGEATIRVIEKGPKEK